MAQTPQDLAIRRHEPDELSSYARDRFAGIKPRALSSILKKAERGDVREWMDFCAWMCERDSQIRSVCATNINAIAVAKRRVEPATDRPVDIEAAKRVAGMFDESDELPEVTRSMAHAEHTGAFVGEHITRTEGREVRSHPIIHPSRDLYIDPDRRIWLRSIGPNATLNNLGESPGKWLLHMSRFPGSEPHMGGALHAVSWLYLFKRLGLSYWVKGAQRQGNGIVVANVPNGTATETTDKVLTMLKTMSSDQAGVFDDATRIAFNEPSGRGEVWVTLAEELDKAIAKGILGSTLNVDVQTTGSRALGESQFSTTILPRWEVAGIAIATTLRRQWVEPYLEWNADLFSEKPLPPRIMFDFVDRRDPASAPAWELLVDTDNVENDSLRTARGLEAWGDERGKQTAKRTAAPAAPMFSDTIEGSGPAEVPLRQTMTRTSQTSLDSKPPVKALRFAL